jgi:hypothetical protein
MIDLLIMIIYTAIILAWLYNLFFNKDFEV